MAHLVIWPFVVVGVCCFFAGFLFALMGEEEPWEEP